MNLPVTRSPLALCRLVVATAARCLAAATAGLRLLAASAGLCLAAGAAGLCWPSAALLAASPEFSPKQVEFFEAKVRPVLAGTCQKCHGGANHKGGLRLDSRESALKGGDSGAAVVPGNPSASPMIDAVNYRGLEMPPTGKLKPREIEALAEWVKMGAPWPK
jgi:hypothetical protein